jgi:hypothetical protein
MVSGAGSAGIDEAGSSPAADGSATGGAAAGADGTSASTASGTASGGGAAGVRWASFRGTSAGSGVFPTRSIARWTTVPRSFRGGVDWTCGADGAREDKAFPASRSSFSFGVSLLPGAWGPAPALGAAAAGGSAVGEPASCAATGPAAGPADTGGSAVRAPANGAACGAATDAAAMFGGGAAAGTSSAPPAFVVAAWRTAWVFGCGRGPADFCGAAAPVIPFPSQSEAAADRLRVGAGVSEIATVGCVKISGTGSATGLAGSASAVSTSLATASGDEAVWTAGSVTCNCITGRAAFPISGSAAARASGGGAAAGCGAASSIGIEGAGSWVRSTFRPFITGPSLWGCEPESPSRGSVASSTAGSPVRLATRAPNRFRNGTAGALSRAAPGPDPPDDTAAIGPAIGKAVGTIPVTAFGIADGGPKSGTRLFNAIPASRVTKSCRGRAICQVPDTLRTRRQSVFQILRPDRLLAPRVLLKHRHGPLDRNCRQRPARPDGVARPAGE